jgi:multiple sugar transport system substrate-binding protein
MKKILITALIALFIAGCQKHQVTLSLWIGGAPDEVNYLEKLIHEFEAQTGYHVIFVRQPTDSDQRRQSLVVPLGAHQPDPDVFLMDVVWVGQFVQSGWLEPFNKYMGDVRDSLKPFFQPVIRQVDMHDSLLYALPLYVDGGLLYYRKDLLKENGHLQPPQTWSELLDWSQEIQKKERKTNPDFYGFVWQGAQYEGLVCDFLEFASSAGGGLSRGDSISADQPENARALQFMHDLINKYRISPPNTYTEMKEEEVRRWFQQGNALFERNWPYAWKMHQEDDSPVKGKVEVAPLPHFKGGRSASTLGGWHIGISKWSDDKQSAWELVHFLTSEQTQKKLALNLSWNPGRVDVYNDPEVLAKMPHLKALQSVFEHAVVRPLVPYYSQVSEVLQRDLNLCLANKIGAAEALKDAQSQIEGVEKVYQSK